MRAVALTPSAFAAAISRPPQKYYGRLTIDGWNRHRWLTGRELVVWLDGVNVTRDCREADDVAGYAIVMRAGSRVVGDSPFERRHGEVVITETEATS